MTNQTNRPEEPDSEETKTEQTSAGKSGIASFFGKTMQYWLAFLLVTTLVIHGIGWAYYKAGNTAAPTELSPEIGLGNFKFMADKTAGSRIATADFSLYITALEGLDRIARTRLASHKYRVQEEIEFLLRQAHSGDFDDPSLNDLKRQIRERVDQTLGNRVVSGVIITNLKLSISDIKEPVPTADMASSPPWLEKSPSSVSQPGGN